MNINPRRTPLLACLRRSVRHWRLWGAGTIVRTAPKALTTIAPLILHALLWSAGAGETRGEAKVRQGQNNPGINATNISSRKQLFLDDYMIEKVENVQRQLHRPVRYAANPILLADKAWERGPGANGIYLFGGTVLFDEEDQIFKMWYRNSLVYETGKTP